MGCRPSRSALGRVSDSTCEYNRNLLEEIDRRKKGKGKRKAPKYNDFSSTTRFYNRTEGTSKITVRLSTDGSMLEIEQFDFESPSTEHASENSCDTLEFDNSNDGVLNQDKLLSADGKAYCRSKSAPLLSIGQVNENRGNQPNLNDNNIDTDSLYDSTTSIRNQTDSIKGTDKDMDESFESMCSNKHKLTNCCETECSVRNGYFPTSNYTGYISSTKYLLDESNDKYETTRQSRMNAECVHSPRPGNNVNMDPKMNPLSCSICQNGAEANRLRSNCAGGGFETLRDGVSKHHGNKCTKRTLNDKIKEHGLCIICPSCFGKHAFRRSSSITEDENSATIKDTTITCRTFYKDGKAISSDTPEVEKIAKAVPSENSILANMDHSLVSSPYKQTQNTTNMEHSLQEINTCECRPDLCNISIDPCAGPTSMPISQITRNSNNTKSLQGEKTEHSKLQDPQRKSISPLSDNTSRTEMKTQLEKSSIGITATSETLLADKFLKSISISTRCSDEIEKFCYSQELSWLNQTLPKTRIICDSRDSAAEDEYLDTCDCEFCRIHTAASGSSLSPGRLTGKETETADKEDYGLYGYAENDNECIWKYDEQDKSNGECSDGAVHGDEEDCLRCGKADRSYSYQNDTDCASASDYSESERVGRLVSSLFTRNGRSYTFTDDEENDGDIDSSDDGRDVYMDAMETSYV